MFAKRECEQEPAICGMSLAIDSKNAFYKHTGEFGEKKYLILTGHKDGRVAIWKFNQFQAILMDYKDEVTCMNYCSEGIVFGTSRGFLYVVSTRKLSLQWDKYLSACVKVLELSNLSFKILSFHIVGIDYNQQRLLVSTLGGDALELRLSLKKDPKPKRYNSITKVNGTMRSFAILN